MRFKLQEFIDSNYKDIISGDESPEGMDGIRKTHKTTDQMVGATRSRVSMGLPGSYGYGGGMMYERSLSENEMPYNEEADAMCESPEEFNKFLQEKGVENTFESYFVEKKIDLKKELKEDAKNKAIKMAEQILSQRKENSDVIDNKPLPEIDDIKEKDELLFSKLEKIGDYIQKNMSIQEKIVIDKYFNKLIHGE